MEDLKRCNKCGVEKPNTLIYFVKAKNGNPSPKCKECQSRYQKEYRENNKDRLKQYREENKERISEYDKEYRNNNRELLLERKRQWTKENKQYIQEYRIKNKDRDSENGKKWSQTERGRELNNLATQKRRERIKALPLNFTKKDWIKCLESFEYRCAYCGEKSKLEHEHFIPIDNYGSYTKDNILCSCRTCNASKANDDFFYWYPLQNFYNKERELKILDYLNEHKGSKGRVANG